MSAVHKPDQATRAKNCQSRTFLLCQNTPQKEPCGRQSGPAEHKVGACSGTECNELACFLDFGFTLSTFPGTPNSFLTITVRMMRSGEPGDALEGRPKSTS